MKRTDYAGIADRYDENALRLSIPHDAPLAALVAALGAGAELRALDVACGTGNYLAAQRAAYGDRVRWTGADASEAMLARAREKAPAASLHVARAEALPFEDGAFDYVVSSFAFHHFEDKPRALDELRRVLRKGGTLRILNVTPSHMRRGWLFRFFPEAWLEDEKRYWSPELLHHELEQRGFAVTTRVAVTCSRRRVDAILADVERRDASELAILTEAEYARGLARVRAELASDRDASVIDEIATVEARALG
ncbi:MAG TPA: methyltransferase domain-containing protein [Byssovorax sp.]|jgi:ubiquinone/menaquinone biosynthesis C-methylase UbiE